jgi:basic membrane protein A
VKVVLKSRADGAGMAIFAAGSIEMKYTYTGAFGNSPDFQAKAAAWYQSGTECIFGCGAPDNVFAACEATGGDCVSIGVDTDMSQITETCLTSAMKMLVPAVYGAIKAYYNDTFPGGTSETLTINDDAVGLPMETSRFKNFTQADYDAIVEVLKADKDGVTSSIRRDVDADGNTVTIEDVAATLQYVTVQVVE